MITPTRAQLREAQRTRVRVRGGDCPTCKESLNARIDTLGRCTVTCPHCDEGKPHSQPWMLARRRFEDANSGLRPASEWLTAKGAGGMQGKKHECPCGNWTRSAEGCKACRRREKRRAESAATARKPNRGPSQRGQRAPAYSAGVTRPTKRCA